MSVLPTTSLPAISPSPPHHSKTNVITRLNYHQHTTSLFPSFPPRLLFSTRISNQSPHRQFSTHHCSSSMHSTEEASPLLFQGSLEFSRAYWVNRDLIAWNVDVAHGSCYLFSSTSANLSITNTGIEGHDVKIKLESDLDTLPASVVEKFPHIHDYRVFKVPHGVDVKSLLKCQLAVALFDDPSKLAELPPDSDEQQAEVTAIQDNDGYNWGYDPVLWGVPKGSYASNPNGPCRTHEFRQMVQALNRNGLRVVLDVVYNHLQGNGPHDANSVLNKVVPGYYLRRNSDGCIEHSTCTNNTASEHFMVERLIVDDLVSWAVNYKVDGFRFDLMGHIMKRTMVKAKRVLQSLSKDKHGVDGSKIYIYGEGWDFGEVSKNGRGVNASQFNICGTGIGSFNDRIRDAVLGGSPFGNPLQQGFVTGLSFQPNGHDHGNKTVVHNMLAASQDHIQVGMAGNLRDFVLTSHQGKEVKGSEVLTYDGLPVAYALCPTETINYVSAHDNETLFDIISLKTPMEISMNERCRVNLLASSIVALSQGIPFFHCGDDMLRSKSLDRDSYNSGDWFNRLDFSYESNNWGVGLPPKGKNENNWPLIKPRLADPSFKPHKSNILSAVDNFLNMLQIRYSSPLFRLGSANSIQERVRFHNTGPSYIPGFILMSIEDGHKGMPGLTQLDPLYSYIVIAFNAQPTEVSFTSSALRARALELHPVHLMASDELVKTSKYDATVGNFNVPPRTTSVFVEPRVISLMQRPIVED